MGVGLQSRLITVAVSSLNTPTALWQLQARGEPAHTNHHQKKIKEIETVGSYKLPVLAQERDVNAQGSCGEGRSEESVW